MIEDEVFEESGNTPNDEEYQVTILDIINEKNEQAAESIGEARPFMTTPFTEYTVTEGFCLAFFFAMVISIIHHYVRRFV